MHAAIAVAIGDVEVAVRAHRDVGRAVERPTGARDADRILAVVAGVRRRVPRPQRHERLAGRRELAHGVVAVVGAEDGAVRTDRDAARAIGELAVTPGAQDIALAVVDDARMAAGARAERGTVTV